MPRFNDVDVFLAVADAASFRDAARTLGLTKSTVSRAIQRLEEHLGASLITRDRQGLRLTAAGVAYRRAAREASNRLRDAERAVAAIAKTVHGTVRISAPQALGQACLAAMCATFLEAHEGVEIELSLTDRMVSFTADEVDLVVRAGAKLPDSDLRVRRLAEPRMLAVASPRLAARLPALPSIPFVQFRYPNGLLAIHAEPPLPLEMRFVADDYLALRSAVIAGAGVGVFSELLISEELLAGTVVRVFPDWSLPRARIWALQPGGPAVPRIVRALVDHLVEGFDTALRGDRTTTS